MKFDPSSVIRQWIGRWNSDWCYWDAVAGSSFGCTEPVSFKLNLVYNVFVNKEFIIVNDWCTFPAQTFRPGTPLKGIFDSVTLCCSTIFRYLYNEKKYISNNDKYIYMYELFVEKLQALWQELFPIRWIALDLHSSELSLHYLLLLDRSHYPHYVHQADPTLELKLLEHLTLHCCHKQDPHLQ